MNMNEIVKCPKCSGELEKGVIQASYIVFWNKADVEEDLTSQWRAGKNAIESEAWRCNNCQLIVFYYGKNAKKFNFG
jgi:hypothetical protein